MCVWNSGVHQGSALTLMALDPSLQILILFLTLIFAIPPLRWVYKQYLKPLLDIAAEKADEYKRQLSERLSDAGRKLSAKMRQ